jgi:peptidoglycan hydrolase CwlO-like protein
MKESKLVDKAMAWIGSTSSLIVHTIIFGASFALALFGIGLDHILLVVTTLVSLEAIYMAIFIQMAVNRNTQSLQEVEKDIDEIQEDVDEIQKDIDEIQEDVDDIEKDDDQHLLHGEKTQSVLTSIEVQLQNLIKEIEEIKHKRG